MHRRLLGLVLGAALILGAVAPAPAAPRRAERFEVVVERDVPIKMSDGATLYANILRPGRDGEPVAGRFPVVLTQTPYNKNSGSLAFEAPFLVERGYVQVIVDVRGTGSSEGRWDSFGPREQRDGAELVGWVASSKREWSDGRVALYGTSYGAINQLFTAAQRPEGLKAAFPIVPMADAYRDITGSGGQINTSFIPLWLGLVTGLGQLPPTYAPSNPQQWAEVEADHLQGAVEFQAQTVASATTGGENAYDNPFFRTRSPIEVIDRVEVPTFVVGGWFDLFQRGEPMLFDRLQANGVPTKLLMGPWYHITAGEGLPLDGVPPLEDLALAWFDRYVKGIPQPKLDAMPAVTYMELGAGRYRTAPSWPPPQTRFDTVYLSGPARPGAPGALAPKPPKGQDPDVMLWNPAAGACSRSTVQWTSGIGQSSPCETDGEFNDQLGLAYDLRATRDIRLAGPIAARLFVSTNGRDGMLTVRVEDVAPDGRSTQLTAGWQVISLRKLDHKRTVHAGGTIVQPYHPFTKGSVLPVESGEIYEVWVEVFPTAAVIAKGHALRVSVTPADSPHLSPPLPQLAASAGGVLEIHHDPKHPSSIVLPVLP